MSVLNRILKTKQEEVTERKNRISERDLMSTLLAGRQRLSMRKALEESATGIIAEFKRKSPSGGFIHEAAGVQEVVGGYVRNGAAACSVLTDTDYFGGSLLDLAMARRVSDIPLLRKDFIVDSYQLAEAVAYGADAVLLIAAALSPAQCRELADAAHGLGLEILLEIHREEELEYVSPEMDMVGINNRNLTTFETDIYTSFRLASQVPVACLKVAESGIRAMETAGKLVDNDELRDALKENGIGRPSTRAAIIETLFKRNYIRKERKNLIATPTGVELVQIIHEELLKSAELTGIWEKKLREIEKKTYDARQFLEELKQMVSEIVMSVLSDNTNRRITIQEAVAQTEEKAKKEPKKRERKASAPKEKKAKAESKVPASSPSPASIPSAPASAPATGNADTFVGQPCPVCGKGTIIKGKTAYGCSEWRNGCTYRKNFE